MKREDPGMIQMRNVLSLLVVVLIVSQFFLHARSIDILISLVALVLSGSYVVPVIRLKERWFLLPAAAWLLVAFVPYLR